MPQPPPQILLIMILAIPPVPIIYLVLPAAPLPQTHKPSSEYDKSATHGLRYHTTRNPLTTGVPKRQSTTFPNTHDPNRADARALFFIARSL
jgi:hypothetical protein